ncbi:MAG: hypothetical protein F4X09_12020 [Gammaproteobacteria bacterium]|nr:hypothetical protein [Gammaproteobacteria bacterium]MYI03005.1 hypothetical protein [Gammaproteobacteria bacterium]
MARPWVVEATSSAPWTACTARQNSQNDIGSAYNLKFLYGRCGSMPSSEAIRDLVAACVGQVGAPVTALRKIVDTHGHIEDEHVRIVADVFNLSLADVRGIVSFYADFRTSPRGRKHIRICQAEACQSVGSRALTKEMTEALGIALGDTSEDHAVSLDGVYCLGLCASGPCAMVNERILVHATREELLT